MKNTKNKPKFNASKNNQKPYRKSQEEENLPRKKKGLGQHFLRKQSTVDNMIAQVKISPETTVLEIGCGDGFLTRSILSQTIAKQLRCYEIDPEWATYVKEHVKDPRLDLQIKNILQIDFAAELESCLPIVILANLPYQITFPILFIFQKHKHLIQEGVVMIQEEVAQKIVASHGRGYGPTGLFLQHHFELKLLEKIEPGAFSPPPKVFSRLLYLKPKTALLEIPDEEQFWDFLKLCFKSPRQTLKNNLRSTHYDISLISESLGKKRAQELVMEELVELWNLLKNSE